LAFQRLRLYIHSSPIWLPEPEAPGFDQLTASLGEDAQCFRGTITIAGRKPTRHLVAISAELAKTRPGADPQGKRTILCDNDPAFVLYRIAQRFGLPVVPDWAGWFNEELNRRGAVKPLIGVGCSAVLVSGTKKLFLKWIRRALRQKPGSQFLSSSRDRPGRGEQSGGRQRECRHPGRVRGHDILRIALKVTSSNINETYYPEFLS
jgi:hypothetical protein